MNKYRKKPVIIEAMQYKVIEKIPCKYGVHEETNSMEIATFMGEKVQNVHFDERGEYIEIPTLEGVMRASIGDYIIQGVKGELYPCKPDIFETTYEKVD